jgi:hypothetical protein
MTPDACGFYFDDEPLELDPEKDFIAEIPVGLVSRDLLFDALRKCLQLPSYFGSNWDALSECLRDLSWIKQRRVVLLHREVPRLDPQALVAYLGVLRESVFDWRAGEDHELVVVFPKETQAAITSLCSGIRLE